MKDSTNDTSWVVGVLSDTHGDLPAWARRALLGSDLIVHAGDIVSPAVLDELRTIAPVTAVRGNMDGGRFGDLPRTAVASAGDVLIYVLHDLGGLDLDPRAAGISVVIHGHTHRAEIETVDGVLFLNPGSTSLPRGEAPASVARLTASGGELEADLIWRDTD